MNWSTTATFISACEQAGIATPAPLIRGQELITQAQAVSPPRGGLLALTDEQVDDRVRNLTITPHALQRAADEFTDEIAHEVREAVLPYLEDITEQLRPEFDILVTPIVTAAQEYGFTWETTSDEVIDLANEGAAQAWRDARAAWHKLNPIVNLRTEMSKVFAVTPTALDGRGRVNYSIAFAAGNNWGTEDAYHVTQRGRSYFIDWFALAQGGIRLNTPAETAEKIRSRK